MNKSEILKGIHNGEALPFKIAYHETYNQIPYIRQQFQLLEETEKEQEEIKSLSYDKFKLFWETGDRSIYQDAYYAKRKRLLLYAMLLWRRHENLHYKHELENVLWDICSEPVWALPAHFTDKEGKDLPFEKYEGQIDLFAAETGFAIAETLRMCEPFLSKRCIEFARIQLNKRIIEPFLDGNQFYPFEIRANNWAAVCGGAVGCVGILLLKDEEKLTNFLHRAISCIEVYLQSFGEDGVCVEGVDYWSYGFGFFVCFADYLKQRTNGQLNFFRDKKVEQIALNQQAYYLVGNHTISFADGRDEGRYRIGLSMYLKKCYPAVQLPPLQYAQSILEDTCYRFCLALRDILWYDPNIGWQGDKKQSVWLSQAQWFLSHGNTFILVAKGGHNGESHNHNDCGSFILYKNGVPMLEDLGAGLYNADYFSNKRYDIFVNASRSHNVPIIAGTEQRAGKEYGAQNVLVNLGTIETFQAELQSCYPSYNLESFVRRIKHNIEENYIELEDLFKFNKPDVIQERFISRSPINIEGTSVVIKNGKEELKLYFDEGYDLQVLKEEYENHKMEECIAYILQASKKDKRKNVCCRVLIK